MIATAQLLSYAATNHDAAILFIAHKMSLHESFEASHLSVTKVRSLAAGCHYLSDWPIDPSKTPLSNDLDPTSNDAIEVYCQILKEVLSIVAKSELAPLFHNGEEACPLCTCLYWGIHNPRLIQTNNKTAAGIAIDSVKRKHSKVIDMCFYWVCDTVHQGHFLVYWEKGILNKAD